MDMLTTKQAREVLLSRGIEVPYPTIALWVREGRFEGAELEETPRGPVWKIPRASVETFDPPTRGRPPKPKTKKAGKKRGKR